MQLIVSAATLSHLLQPIASVAKQSFHCGFAAAGSSQLLQLIGSVAMLSSQCVSAAAASSQLLQFSVSVEHKRCIAFLHLKVD